MYMHEKECLVYMEANDAHYSICSSVLAGGQRGGTARQLRAATGMLAGWHSNPSINMKLFGVHPVQAIPRPSIAAPSRRHCAPGNVKSPVPHSSRTAP